MMKLNHKEKYILADILVRLLTSDDNWIDSEFGTEKNRLYVDGDVFYKNDKEKELIKKIIGFETRDY